MWQAYWEEPCRPGQRWTAVLMLGGHDAVCDASAAGVLPVYVCLLFGCAGCSLLHTGSALVAASRGFCLVVTHGLLAAVASLVADHGLQGARAQQCDHGVRCPTACGIFRDQGSNPCPLHWRVDA